MNFQDNSQKGNFDLNVSVIRANAKVGDDATCYWTYVRKFLGNHYNFIRCNDCSSKRAHRIFDRDECQY